MGKSAKQRRRSGNEYSRSRLLQTSAAFAWGAMGAGGRKRRAGKNMKPKRDLVADEVSRVMRELAKRRTAESFSNGARKGWLTKKRNIAIRLGVAK